MKRIFVICYLLFLYIIPEPVYSQPIITGELKQWHKITLTFSGPMTSEKGTPNPFTDYRMNVYFTNSGDTIVIPGYYAADGNAHNTSDSAGNAWRVHFNPPAPGIWNYTVTFRQGNLVAVSTDPIAGTPVIPLDGYTGSFTVQESDKTGKDLRSKGWLEHFNDHYYKFKGDGSYFLKQGLGSPENFLAYWEFDNTIDNPGGLTTNLPDGLHHYEPHIPDWKPGDTTWKDGLGKGIIGAINYLSSEGINSVFMLLMNVYGDGREVYPWTSYTERRRFDVSKLDQWELVFSYMESKGLALHFVLQEAENDRLLNSGDLGTERMLYYREMIARFAHHNAVFWNLGEENNRSTAQLKADASFFKTHDPYRHPVKVHSKASLSSPDQLYIPLLGDRNFDATSLQQPHTVGHSIVLKWRNLSSQSGFKWVIEHDEINGGVHTDSPSGNNQATMRKNVLWGNLTGGGGGTDWYFGYDATQATDDIDCEDFRSRDLFWDYGRNVLNLFHHFLPFYQMTPMDNRISNNSVNWVLGDTVQMKYLAFLSKGGTATINLPSGIWRYRIYNPVTGNFISNPVDLTNGNLTAPAINSDWAFFIYPANSPNFPPVVSITTPQSGDIITSFEPSAIKAHAIDADGTVDLVEFYIDNNLVSSDSTFPYEFIPDFLPAGSCSLKVIAYDNNDASDSDSVQINVVYHSNLQPIVTLTSPPDNFVYETGSDIEITALAQDIDGRIAYVEFYQNNFLLSLDSIAPYTYTWNDVQNGQYLITAKAVDDSASIALDSVSITVSPVSNHLPLVNITEPAPHAEFSEGDDVLISATANDPDGEIVKLEFYQNNQLIATDSLQPYNFLWENISEGAYTIIVKAYDDSGAFSLDSVSFSVTQQEPEYISGFTLINANTDIPVPGYDPIPDDAVINRNITGNNLNIRANIANPGIGSIKFELNGVTRRIENQAPYSMWGDNSGNYNSWTPAPGQYKLKGYAYSLTNARGILLDTLSTNFTVINQAEQQTQYRSKSIIYPNPVENQLTIILDEDTEIAEVCILSVQGIRFIPENTSLNKNTITINTGQLNSGFYFIEIITQDGTKLTRTFQK